MYLRDLTVELSSLAELPSGYSPRQFHDSTHAVVERYLDLLPRRRVKLAEAAKVIVHVGRRPTSGIGVEQDFLVYPDGIAFLWLHDFGLDLDLAHYVRADRATQQQLLLSSLDEGLLAVARRTGDDSTPFEQAAQALRAQGFPLEEIPEAELRRRWGLLPGPAKKRRAAGARGRRQQPRPDNEA